MIIDAKDLIAGRLCAYVAKQLLLGEKVDIVNSDKVVLSGSRTEIFEKYAHRRDRGTPTKGPFYLRGADRILKRMVRGMLPHRQEKGSKAYDNLKCYIGVPTGFKDQKMDDLKHLYKTKHMHKSKLTRARTVTLGEASKHVGGK